MATTTSYPLATAAADLDAMNSFLRGEISAVETYEQAIEKFRDYDVASLKLLHRIRAEHADSVDILRTRVLDSGGIPAAGAGVWGAFANVVEGTAKLFGPQTTLAALRQGELVGVDIYEAETQAPEVSVECRYLIRNEFLPRCHEHIATLDRMIEQLERNDK